MLAFLADTVEGAFAGTIIVLVQQYRALAVQLLEFNGAKKSGYVFFITKKCHKGPKLNICTHLHI